MRIDISGKQFVFPRQCACCGRFPGTWLRVSGPERNKNSRTRGWSWDVPYCHYCARHVRLADQVSLGGLSLVALAGVGAFLALITGYPWPFSIAAFLLIGALIFAGVKVVFSRLKRTGYSACEAMNRSVRYLGSSGNWHSFEFDSKAYAGEFVRANRLKLVNASPTILSMLRGSTMSESQVGRRITHRTKTERKSFRWKIRNRRP